MDLQGLTPKELLVFPKLARGGTNQEIANACHITLDSAEKHVKSILRKLKMERTELVFKYLHEHYPPDEEITTADYAQARTLIDRLEPAVMRMLGTLLQMWQEYLDPHNDSRTDPPVAADVRKATGWSQHNLTLQVRIACGRVGLERGAPMPLLYMYYMATLYEPPIQAEQAA